MTVSCFQYLVEACRTDYFVSHKIVCSQKSQWASTLRWRCAFTFTYCILTCKTDSFKRLKFQYLLLAGCFKSVLMVKMKAMMAWSLLFRRIRVERLPTRNSSFIITQSNPVGVWPFLYQFVNLTSKDNFRSSLRLKDWASSALSSPIYLCSAEMSLGILKS